MASFVIKQATKDEQLLRTHLGEMYHEDHCVDQHGFGSHFNRLNLRPKSLAVPGMSSSSSLSTSVLFSFLQEPQVNNFHVFGPFEGLIGYCLVGFAFEILVFLFDLGPSDVHISSGCLHVDNNS